MDYEHMQYQSFNFQILVHLQGTRFSRYSLIYIIQNETTFIHTISDSTRTTSPSAIKAASQSGNFFCFTFLCIFKGDQCSLETLAQCLGCKICLKMIIQVFARSFGRSFNNFFPKQLLMVKQAAVSRNGAAREILMQEPVLRHNTLVSQCLSSLRITTRLKQTLQCKLINCTGVTCIHYGQLSISLRRNRDTPSLFVLMKLG